MLQRTTEDLRLMRSFPEIYYLETGFLIVYTNRFYCQKESPMVSQPWGVSSGAGHEIRTRDFNLGKVALYH